ncbi:MAG: proton-conducting transporter membrane subunit [Gaiellaceae bacterium]
MTLVLPLAIPWFAAVGLVAFDGRRPVVGWLAVGSLAATLAAVVALSVSVWQSGPIESVTGGWPTGVGITLRADALSVLFALLTTAVLLVCLAHEVLAGIESRRFPALVLFMTVGLTGLFLTGDVFNFYVFFEIAMISAYVITGYGGEPRQLSAAFIFAVVNLLGSFLFLMAIAAIYHVTGSLEMNVVAERIADVEPNTVILIAVTVFVAFGVKLGLFPFHFWLPVVYASVRPAIAAILSGALANIGTYGLLRFGADVFPRELEFGATALVVLGGITILYGALQAMSRRTASEVIAYSSIGQIGYVLIALAIGGPVGYAAAVLYAVLNALNKVLLFLASGLRGWLVGAAFFIGVISVAGIPPAAGFFGKLEVFQAAIEDDSAAIVALVFVGGALSVVYLLQIYQHDYWRPGSPVARAESSPVVLRALTFGVAALVLALGLWPEPLLAASREAAEVLLGGAG